MQNEIILVLGGARSGKSGYAQRLAEARWKRPLFLATAEARDEEMAKRVKTHRRRRGRRWECVEEPLDLAGILADRSLRCDGILVDCLTIWLSNVLLREGEAACGRRTAALLRALRRRLRPVILVVNEVGMGIVPEDALARKFRDLAGWLNQDVAAAADTVVWVAAGIPVFLKKRLESC